ncbi:GMC family oxidoreductase [Phormidium tenue FACHB-886]|nr:GMC family oxidoreductase [Phormidium tenue FACHB-886]
MMIDARRVTAGETIDTEVCIIGAGPAGITLATEFAGQDFRVCLLETGGLEPDEAVQSLADGTTTGDAYPGAQYMRTRQFGGTSHQWNIWMQNNNPGGDRGVRYVTLDPLDFEKRDWVPNSGWSFGKETLDPFYERAHAFCQTGPYNYEVSAWETEQAKALPFDGDRVTNRMYQFGKRDIFLKDYRQKIEQSNNVTICLYATATELESDELAQTVKRVRVATLAGNEFWVSAKIVVLAMGTIENARLLLLSDKVNPKGLGNQNDVVGRYYMDHPLVRSGILYPTDRKFINKLSFYDAHWVNGTKVIGKPVLSEAVMRREKLMNINAAIFPRPAWYQHNPLRMLFPEGKRYRSETIKSAQALKKAIRTKQLPKNLLGHFGNLLTGVDDLAYFQWRQKQRIHFPYGLDTGGWSELPNKEQQFACYEVFHITEQAPDPSNRILLSDKRDRLGCRQVEIQWRWNDIDIDSTRRAQQIFAEEFAKVGLGTLKLEFDHDVPVVFLPSTHHNIGSTRMHDDPKQGVVDAKCQVHGVPNLLIASSSVFPAGGYANPTLTIIAIAIRVADEVKARMAA